VSVALAERLWGALQRWLEGARRPLLVGLAGPQGAGKSTMAQALERRAAAAGVRLVSVSLDDFYLTRSERARLAAQAHPLFVTRGPPGSHDVVALAETLEALRAGRAARLWRFDKGLDDRAPETTWRQFDGLADLVLLEGWCVGAAPEPPERLKRPINALEAIEDPLAAWRMAANSALAGPYRRVFSAVDRLVLLTAPDFQTVSRWRAEQEQSLPLERRMSAAQLSRFLQHFERITAWMAEEAVMRADLHLRLRPDRTFEEP